jgi:hypothetical protein
LLLASTALAQQKFDFYSRGPYRASVPRPASITGYQPGDFQTPHGQIVRVAERIAAAAPDRVRLVENGQTWEYRKLYLAVVSSSENLARLDEIKASLAKLADPRRITAEEEVTNIARSNPIVVWLNFGIHGNESASYESVQQVLYQLAASDEPRTLEILKNVVVVINLMHNPDGHERFAVWENSVAIGNAEPFSLEHREPYQIYGRGNRYRFDLNRDMLAFSQPESYAVVRGVREWKPQVFVDHHGQVTSYFFPPAAEPINKNLPLEKTRYWYDRFGRNNAAAFDRYGWTYYVRHVFDMYYAGYQDSWSSLVGATGMTYETDGGGPRSLRLKRDDETILSFRDGIAKHFAASMATLETASDNREARLKDFYQFFKTAIDEARSDKMKRIVLLPGRDPGRTAALVQNLVLEGIEVTLAREPFRSSSAHNYLGSESLSREFPAGAYVIDLNQPQRRLARAHLEPNPELDQAFIKKELERRARNERRGKRVEKEDYEFYDITSWSLPLAFGVEAFWTEDAQAVKGAQIETTPSTFGPGYVDPGGSLLKAADGQPLPALAGGVEGGRANSAYIIPYGTDASARLSIALLREEFKLAVATRQLNATSRNWPAGTLIARVDRNPETLHERVAALASETKAKVFAANSAFAEEGDTGIGSESVISLKRPRVLVVWDESSSPTSFGAMWFMFERSYGLDFTPVTISTLKSLDLSRFNVIVFPDGNASAYQSALGKDGVEKLKGWVSNGAVLIGIGGAAAAFAHKDVNLTSSRLIGADEPPATPAAATPTPAASDETKPAQPQSAAGKLTDQEKPKESKDTKPVEKPAEKAGEKPGEKKRPTEPIPVPGAAFRVKLDKDHFLSYGYDSDQLVVLMGGDTFFKASKEGANVATFSGDGQLVVSGFHWPDNTEELLRGTSYLIDEPAGRGHIILFAEDPNFRYLWRSSTQLFLNAILLGTALR